MSDPVERAREEAKEAKVVKTDDSVWINLMEHPCTVQVTDISDVLILPSGFVIRLTSRPQRHLYNKTLSAMPVPIYQPQEYVDWALHKVGYKAGEKPKPHISSDGTVDPIVPATLRGRWFLHDVMEVNECGHLSIIVSTDAAKFLAKHYETDSVINGWLSIYAPDSGPDSAVRDGNGAIKAVRRLNLYF